MYQSIKMNIIRNDIFDIFGKDCGNIILDYKLDLDEFEICKDNYNKLIAIIFSDLPTDFQKPFTIYQEKSFRIDEIRLDHFIYFLQTYVLNLEIFNHFEFKINIRDLHFNFNKDYLICNKTFTFKEVIDLKYSHGDHLIKTFYRKYRDQITISLLDTYEKKPKKYQKFCSTIYFWCMKKIKRTK
jgi:hypothetical protein